MARNLRFRSCVTGERRDNLPDFALQSGLKKYVRERGVGVGVLLPQGKTFLRPSLPSSVTPKGSLRVSEPSFVPSS